MVGVDRRTFLGRSGAAVAGALVGARPATPATPAQPSTEADWQAVRDQFALDPAIAPFAAFVLASPPKVVRDAIEHHRRALDFDNTHYVEQNNDTPARTAAAEYLDVLPDEIALTASTTMGLGIVYGGLDLSAGDEVLTTEHDFFSTHEALRRAAVRTGATVNRIRLYDRPSAADEGEIVDRIVGAITPTTRLVAITWVHSGTGVKLPVRTIADALAEHNRRHATDRPVLLFVDGLHGFGVEDETAASLGSDVFVSGAHKWLWGPRGTGLIWATPAAWESIAGETPPFEQRHFDAWLNGTDPERAPGGPANTPGGYVDFEHRLALAEAFDFHRFVGKAAIMRRTHDQATQLKEGLAEIDGVTLITPVSTSLSAGIVCLECVRPPVFEIVGRLRAEGFGTSITPYREPYLRIGPSIVTSPEQVDALLAAVRRMVNG